jgi:hypothetical protein
MIGFETASNNNSHLLIFGMQIKLIPESCMKIDEKRIYHLDKIYDAMILLKHSLI